MPGFVLCDPALLMPPPADEEGAAHFWARLIEWSTDHRLRLGPTSYELVVLLLGRFGWPQLKVDNYPPGMAQLAHRALSTMLGQALGGDTQDPPPSLTPRYLGHDEGEAAIGSDAAALHQLRLLALATAEAHWEKPEKIVVFNPPPPESLSLLFEPSQQVSGEVDHAVHRFLKKRRITVVGGIRSDNVVAELNDRFTPQEIRWFDTEPGSRLNLDGLLGLQSRVDVVYCVTGHIGHDESIKAKKCCRKRGVEIRKVEKASEIADDLCRRHGNS
jgi:hypothetical protein